MRGLQVGDDESENVGDPPGIAVGIIIGAIAGAALLLLLPDLGARVFAARDVAVLAGAMIGAAAGAVAGCLNDRSRGHDV